MMIDAIIASRRRHCYCRYMAITPYADAFTPPPILPPRYAITLLTLTLISRCAAVYRLFCCHAA